MLMPWRTSCSAAPGNTPAWPDRARHCDWVKFGARFSLSGLEPFVGIRLGKAVHLGCQRVLEGRQGDAQPVIDAALGEGKRSGTALSQPVGDLARPLEQLGCRHHQADQADALSLGARDSLTGHEVVLGFGDTAQQWPDHCSMVARCHTELGVAIDQLGVFCGNRDICQQAPRQDRHPPLRR